MSALPAKFDPLNRPLLYLSEDDPVTMKHLFEGVFCTGQTGSGKSSGPLKNLAISLLRQPERIGFLVPLSKRGEVDQWIEYARLTGREDDLRIFGPDHPFRTNVLNYIYRAPDARGSRSSEAVSNATRNMMDLRDRQRGTGGDPFWGDSSQILVTSSTDLLGLAGETISFKKLHEVTASLPDSPEEVRAQDWQKSSLLNRLVDKSTARRDLKVSEKNDLAVAIEFFLHDWPRMDPKTRSGILATVQSLTHGFRRGVLAQLFDGESNLTPEDIFSGAIVLLDMPVKEYEVGQCAQVLWRIMFMRAAERRDLNKYPKPIVQFIDEYQYFVCKEDPLFAATARSARVVNIVASQSIDSIRSQFHSHTGNAEADSLLGNFNLKIFAANDHVPTTEWSSKMCGEIWETRSNVSTNLGGQNAGVSAGTNEQRRFLVDPIEFMKLKKGGKENGSMVETILFRSGRPFLASSANHLRVNFSQDVS